ncbi:site-specific integrase [Cloacibacillus evryensis]|uniref:site-specific integrase n=1 Tax=Cloacibacillus evryensis TaxID=508460 RepID=UPI00241E432E|nr:site-specific integrase [Cloacibacillus evryensis]
MEVQPIRDKKVLEKMKKFLRANNLRDYCLFTFGINSGLRISDLLNLRIADIKDDSGNYRNRVSVVERKTGKAKDFPVGDNAIEAIKEYLATRPEVSSDDYLFQSRQGGNRPITRNMAWQILNAAGKYAGVKDAIGTHTMRKTFGYHAYKMKTDLSVIQKLLNHSSPAITLSYIGITRDDLDSVYLNLNL